MDYAAAWNKIGTGTKATLGFSTDRINKATAATGRALDTAAPACAPFAHRWDAEADRRAKLRTPENLKALIAAQRANTSARSTAATAASQRKAAKAASNNPLNGSRRAARTADKAARGHAKVARTDLKTARRNYPLTLKQLAVRVHAAHTIPAGLTSYALSSAEHWTMWPAGTSLSLIGLNAALLAVGRRQVRLAPDDDATAEERRLLERLDPSYWVQHADERGLSGTVPAPTELTPAGLVTTVRLDGRWKPSAFKAKHEEIRAMLGARTALRMEIGSGSHGDRATITLRTRSAADGIELTGWKPGDPWGVDTITGEAVMVPLGRRMLIAGTSGSGKSWSTRALLAEASETPDHRLVVIDPKRVEGINWEHRARVAIYAEDVLDVTDELVAEMHDRLHEIPRGRDTIEISARRPRITVFVDEGAEVITMARKKRAKGTKEEPGDPDWSRIMENLGTLARMARAAEIILIWATQKPTMDAKGGIDPQISAQITYRAALALSTSGESRVVFGEDATERGWHAHDLPMPGVAMLRSGPKAAPHPINTRAFSPADVIALPARPVWQRAGKAPAVPAPAAAPALSLVKDDEPAAAVPDGLTDNQVAVLKAVQDGTSTNAEISKAVGINPGSVARAVDALVKRGLLAKDGTTIRTEVAA